MGKAYRVGTRRSPLAIRQVEEVMAALRTFHPDARFEIVKIDTYGDKDRITPISDIEGSDFFTREIDIALLQGKVDFAVHSAKDLPDDPPKGLVVAAITKSIDPYDALVSKNNLRLDELASGARIGASSARRKTQLKAYRADLQVVDIRGNIEERLRLLDGNPVPGTRYPVPGLDAVIIAACALIRLGLEHRITERIPFEVLKPHPLQGSLAIEARREDSGLIEILSKIDSREGVLKL